MENAWTKEIELLRNENAKLKELADAAIKFNGWLMSKEGIKNVIDVPDYIYVPFDNAIFNLL